jgi:hypothetical protein
MTEKEAYTEYDGYLDETIETAIIIAGIEFDPVRILRELDPIAYDCGFNDWCDSEGIDTDELE